MGRLDIEYLRDFARIRGMKDVNRHTNKRRICLFLGEDPKTPIKDLFKKYNIKEYFSTYKEKNYSSVVYKHNHSGKSDKFEKIVDLERTENIMFSNRPREEYTYKLFFSNGEPFYISFKSENMFRKLKLPPCRLNKINLDFELKRLGYNFEMGTPLDIIYKKLGYTFPREDQMRTIYNHLNLYYNKKSRPDSFSPNIPVLAISNTGEDKPFLSLNKASIYFKTSAANLDACIKENIQFPYYGKLWSIVEM